MPDIFGLLPSGPLPEPGLTHALDHRDRAIGVLIQQFRDKSRFTRLLDILVRPLQELENVFWDLLTLRRLATATGVQLDVIGRIVAEPRGGLSDTDYRAVLRIKILVLKSKGTAEDLINITKTALQSASFTYAEFFPAAVQITLTGVITTSLAQLIKKFLGKAKAAGVRLDVIASASSGNLFTYGDVGAGTNVTTSYDNGQYLGEI